MMRLSVSCFNYYMKTKSVEKLKLYVSRITLMKMKEIAQALVNNGYEIIPEKLGTKLPAVREWLNSKYSADDINENNGIAIKTGAVVAIDFDILDESLCNHMKSFFESIIPIAPQRVGKAPKTMFICKAAADEVITKQSSAKYGELKCQVEVLGRGQKFTAYNIHKDTKQPYRWVDLFGGLEVIDFDTLPTITQAQIDSIIDEFETECEKRGLEKLTKRSNANTVAGEGNKDKCGLTIDEARRYLNEVDLSDFETWTRAGLAIAHEFDGSDEGLELYDELSSNANGYDGYEAIVEKYNNCKNVNNITMRTFIHMFNENKNMRMNMIRNASSTQAIVDLLSALSYTDYKDKKDYARAGEIRWRSLAGVVDKNYLYNLIGIDITKEVVSIADLSEFGSADLFVDEYKDTYKYVSDSGSFLKWNNNCFKEVPQVEVKSAIKDSIVSRINEVEKMKLALAGDKANKELINDITRFVNASKTNKMVSNVLELSKSNLDFTARFKNLDSNVDLLGVGNGYINLKDGSLHEPDPSTLITITTDIKYNPAAACPVWLQTLSEIFDGDLETVEAFQRIIGYSITGKPIENKIVIAYGCGSNGKSTLFNTIKNVLGGHAKVSASDTFANSGSQSNGAPREDILRLAGARYVYVSELDENAVLKESLVKSLTGGEAMPARGLYSKHTVEVQPMFTAFIPTNHKPIIKGDDHGIWRRLVLINFGVNFDKHPVYKKDVHRNEKLAAEYEGILAWIVEGCLKYKKHGLLITDKMKEDLDSYKDDMDLLSSWIDDCCELGDDKVATNSQLFSSWKVYAERQGDFKYISTQSNLSRRLASKFERIKDAYGLRGRGFKGIALKPVEDF